MKVITFKIDEALLEKLNTFVRLSGRSRSEVIRAALRKYLAEKAQQLEAAPRPRLERRVIVLW